MVEEEVSEWRSWMRKMRDWPRLSMKTLNGRNERERKWRMGDFFGRVVELKVKVFGYFRDQVDKNEF